MIKQYKEQMIYFLKNKKYIISVILISILSYGFTITHSALGIDDISIDTYTNETIWISSRRWGMWLIYNLFNIKEFTPFWLDFITTIFIGIIAFVICCFIKKNFGEKIKSIWTYVVLSCLLISNPLINQLYIYQASNLSVILSNLGVIIIAILVYENYFNENKKNKKNKNIYLLLSLGLSACFSTYESCAQTYLVCILIMLFLRSCYNKTENKNNVKFFLVNGIIILLGILLYIFENIFIGIIFKINNIQMNNYANNSSMLFDKEFYKFPLYLRMTIAEEFITSLLNDIKNYFPITVYTVAIIITLLVELIYSIKNKKIGKLLLFICIVLSNYIIPVLQLTILYRTEFSIIITSAFLITYLYNIFSTKKSFKYVTNIAIILLLIYQTKTLNQYFYNDYQRYEREKFIVNNIAIELVNDFDYQNKPVVFVTKYDTNTKNQKFWTINKDNSLSILLWGIKAFDEEQKQVIKFMNYYGYNFIIPTKSQIKKATEEYDELEDIKKENIVEFEEYIVINLDKYDMINN